MIPDPSRRDRMIAMYQRGVPCADLAVEFEVQGPAVRKMLARAGVYQGREHRPMPDDFVEQVATGKSIRELRDYYNAGTGVVRRWVSEFGERKRSRTGTAQRSMPEDFAQYAAVESVTELTRRYGCGTAAIARWRKEVGGTAPTRVTKPMPDGFALVAASMTVRELRERYGIGKVTLYKWCKHAGVTPRRAKPAPVPCSSAMGRAKPAPVQMNRDTSRAGQAADYLRRFGPVIRCSADGRYDPKGSHWRRGCSDPLTADEVIARAVRNGFRPDAWRDIAA